MFDGRMVDLDSHLMLFPGVMEEILGAAPNGATWPSRGGGGSLLDEIRRMLDEEGVEASGAGPALEARRAAARLDPWSVRLWGAHGAQIAADRVDALDRLGIERQLVFSQFMEPALCTDAPEGAAACARYNDHALAWASGVGDRVVPVCLLNTADVGGAIAEARRVLDAGAGGVQIAGILPPGGLAPSAPPWDPLWAMLAEAGVPALVHYGGTGGSPPLVHLSWYLAAWESLRPPAGDPDADDFHARPFVWMTAHLYAEITATFLVLGGVFERHPGLRFGVIESGASWVAAWCRRMDALVRTTSGYLGRVLSLEPSEYVRRQMVVTPFVFEPVGEWIERDGFAEVYAFSTDYPHLEGGNDPVQRFGASLAPLGDPVAEQFFVANGARLVGAPVAATARPA